MNLRTLTAITILTCLPVPALVACGDGNGSETDPPPVTVHESDPDDETIIQVPLPDGRTIWCVEYKEDYGGGISCDWDHPIVDIGTPTSTP